MSNEAFSSEYVRKLKEYLVNKRKNPDAIGIVELLGLLDEWFEQNPPVQSEVPIGLSDEQVKYMAYDCGLSVAQKERFIDWQQAQTFVQHQPHTPNWADAPSWANWLAQDLSGAWVWYHDKPLPNSHEWARNGFDKHCAVRINQNWQQTLQQRPKPVVEVGQQWKNNETGELVTLTVEVIWKLVGNYTTIDDFVTKFSLV